jgi:hypothetical protein
MGGGATQRINRREGRSMPKRLVAVLSTGACDSAHDGWRRESRRRDRCGEAGPVPVGRRAAAGTMELFGDSVVGRRKG